MSARGHWRAAPCLALLLLAAGCSQPLRYTVVLLEEQAGGPTHARVLGIALGEPLYWRTNTGDLGQGHLLAVEGDTLLVARRRGTSWHLPEGLQRLALADLQELERWDRQAEPVVSTLVGLPLLLGVIGLLLIGIGLSSIHNGG